MQWRIKQPVQWCVFAAMLLIFGAFVFETQGKTNQVDAADVAGAAERIAQFRDQSSATLLTAQDPSGESAEPAKVQVGPLPDNELLPLGAGEGDLFSGESVQAKAGSFGDGWLLSTLAALGVVLAIVFGIRWVLRRGGVVSVGASHSSVVEVLSRTTIAPRSHVVLMRVGQRILVVSDSPAGMRTLTSVHEPEEVADLLGAIDAGKPTSMSHNFGSVMKKISGQWSGDGGAGVPGSAVEEDGEGSAVDRAEGALARVRGRLAALSEAGGRP